MFHHVILYERKEVNVDQCVHFGKVLLTYSSPVFYLDGYQSSQIVHIC